ncbi:MAG: tetratricopeptide repeat protein [Pirellulaceae bacterium]|nr:tetratricopeptide repeat protein [Pirellulaceae bacterium]
MQILISKTIQLTSLLLSITLLGCAQTGLPSTSYIDKAIDQIVQEDKNFSQEKSFSNFQAKSLSDFETTKNFDPNSQEGLHQLAIAADHSGDYEKSRTLFKKLAALSPKNPNQLNDLGYHYLANGNLTNAKMWLQRALHIDPRHEQATMNLGMVYAEEGDWNQSLGHFRKVLSPEDAHANIGILLAQKGELKAANWHLKQALTINPQQKTAHHFLRHLESQNSL